MPPDPPRIKGLSGLWKIFPSVILNYPLVQKFIETPGTKMSDSNGKFV